MEYIKTLKKFLSRSWTYNALQTALQETWMYKEVWWMGFVIYIGLYLSLFTEYNFVSIIDSTNAFIQEGQALSDSIGSILNTALIPTIYQDILSKPLFDVIGGILITLIVVIFFVSIYTASIYSLQKNSANILKKKTFLGFWGHNFPKFFPFLGNVLLFNILSASIYTFFLLPIVLKTFLHWFGTENTSLWSWFAILLFFALDFIIGSIAKLARMNISIQEHTFLQSLGEAWKQFWSSKKFIAWIMFITGILYTVVYSIIQPIMQYILLPVDQARDLSLTIFSGIPLESSSQILIAIATLIFVIAFSFLEVVYQFFWTQAYFKIEEKRK